MDNKLIEKVQQRECLYDIHSIYYRDQTVRQAAWNEIGMELGLTPENAKEMWIKLRSCFLNALKRRSLKCCEEAMNMASWKHEKQMAFLLPFIEHRKAQGNRRSKALSKNYDTYFSDNDSVDVCKTEIQYHKHEPVEEESKDDRLEPPASKVSKSSQVGETIQLVKEVDEVDMFYLSMARIVKKMSCVEQAKIRVEICRLVSEAEIRNLEEKSAC